MSYGTGAVMAVPGHDERDFAFAKKFNLEIKTVIKPTNGEHQDMYDGEGILINSGPFTNTESQIARDKFQYLLARRKKLTINYVIEYFLVKDFEENRFRLLNVQSVVMCR